MSDSTCRVALLGATGHVGKCLLAALHANDAYKLTAVARDMGKAHRFVDAVAPGTDVVAFDDLNRGRYDVLINCVGVGSPQAVVAAGASIFELTAAFDAMVHDYLVNHSGSRAVSFSSGAAYGGDFEVPAGSEGFRAALPSEPSDADLYGAAKAASERRHRDARQLGIVDLRLFSLFSRHVDLDARYFMCDVVRALLSGDELVVSPDDIVRDYVSPTDLGVLVTRVIEAGPINDVFDVYSAGPVRKSEILERFHERFRLGFRVAEDAPLVMATGTKPNYYSVDHHAESIGYRPTATSLETLEAETMALLTAHRTA